MKKWLKKTLTVLSCTLMVFCISCGLFACKEHPHTFEEISTTATCIAEGERTLVCECGAVKTEHAEKISHDFSKQDASEKYYAGGPDCVAGDKYYYSCSMCGLADTDNTFSIGDGLGHTWKNVEDDKYLASHGTCSTRDIYYQSCEVCGERGTKIFMGSALGSHKWVEVVDEKYFVSAATCVSGATYEMSCSECGSGGGAHFTYGEATDHTYVKSTVPVSCFVDGYDLYTCSECGHSYADMESVVKAPGVHSHTAVVTEPTCTTQGYTTYTCTCGDSYVADYTLADHEYEDTITLSTCSAQGYTLHECKNCDYSFKDNFKPLAEHQFTSEVTKAPTCTEEGVLTTTYTCACNTVYKDVIPVIAHSYKKVETIAPTCESKGYSVYACECGASYNSDYVDEIGHVYTAGESVAATCTEKGSTVYSCTCGDSYVVESAALNHTITQAWEVVTDDNGEEVLTHVEGCKYEKTFVSVCDTCSTTVEKKEEVIKHNYTVSIKESATCKAAGTKLFTCSNAGCNDSYEEKYTVAVADGHQWSEVQTTGDVETVECTVVGCGEKKTTFKAESGNDVKVPKNALTQTGEVQMDNATVKMDEATVKQLADGEGELDLHASTLSDTDKADVMNKVAPAEKAKLENKTIYNFTVNNGAITQFDGMITVTVPYTLEAGEDAEGIVVWYINDNGEIDDIPATYVEINGVGHAVFETDHFSKYTVVRLTPSERCAIYGHDEKSREVKATCTTDGYLLTYCIRCGYNATAEVYKATGHSFNDVVTEATCTTQGYTTHTCKNAGCKESYVDSYVEATGHTFNQKVYEVTCTTDGYIEYSCEKCDVSYREITEEALGHEFKGEKKHATCQVPGHTKYKCIRCNEHYEAEFTPKTGHDYDTEEIESSCNEQGYVKHTCKTCGESYKDNYKPKKEHKYEATVIAPTCTTKGYTLYVCKDKKCGDSYRADYVSELGHSYGADFICTTCGEKHPALNQGEAGFYGNLIDSITSADSYFITLEDFVWTQTGYRNDVHDGDEIVTFDIAKLTFGFDDNGYLVGHGEVIVRMIDISYDADGNVTDEEENFGTIKLILKDEKVYFFLASTYGEENYIVSSQDFMQYYIDFPLIQLREIYLNALAEDTRTMIATALNISDEDVENFAGAVIEFFFAKSKTDAGYAFTLDAQQLYEMLEEACDLTVEELVDSFCGAGSVEGLFDRVNELLGMTVGEFESDISARLEAEGFTLDDFYTLIENKIKYVMEEGNGMEMGELGLKEIVSEYKDLVIGEMVGELVGTTVENISEMLAQVEEMCANYSVVELVLLASGQVSSEQEASEFVDMLLEQASQVIDYIGETSIVINTDNSGKAITITIILDEMVIGGGGYGSSSGSYKYETTAEGKLTIKLNDSYKLEFEGIFDEIEEALASIEFTDGQIINSFYYDYSYTVHKDGENYWFVSGCDKAITLNESNYRELIGQEEVDGVLCDKYVVSIHNHDTLTGSWCEHYGYYYEPSYGLWVNDSCGDWVDIDLQTYRTYEVYYTIWVSGSKTVRSEVNYQMMAEELGNNTSSSVSFWYNTKTKETSSEDPHTYELTDSFQTDECEKYSWEEYTCTTCGNVRRDEHYNYHDTIYSYELLEGSLSCYDGYMAVYSCSKCDYREEKNVYFNNGHSSREQVITLATSCGSATFYTYTCACGYYHENLYQKGGDCNFVRVSGKEYDGSYSDYEKGSYYKCETCGDVVYLASINSEKDGCYTVGGFNVYLNDKVVYEKSYKVANHSTHLTEEVVDGITVETYVCDDCGEIAETYKYDEYGREIYYLAQSGVGYSFEYNECEYIKSYFVSSGEVVRQERGSSHIYEYNYEFLTENRDCEYGVNVITTCKLCDYKYESRYDWHYEYRIDLFSTNTDCGKLEAYIYDCPCGYHSVNYYSSLSLNSECSFTNSSKWLADTETEFDRYLRTYTCVDCGFVYTRYSYKTRDENCMVTSYSVYSFGVTEDGYEDQQVFYYKAEQHNRRVEEGATDDGKYLREEYCTECGKCFYHYEYKNDEFGRRVYYMDRLTGEGYEKVFNADCSYVLYRLDQAGNHIGEEAGIEHAPTRTRYELSGNATSCEEGVNRIEYCPACDEIMSLYENYIYSHWCYDHYEEFDTHCGTVTFRYRECACGKESDIYDTYIYGSCNLAWRSSDGKYVCAITECSFSYEVSTTYNEWESDESCYTVDRETYTFYDGDEVIYTKVLSRRYLTHRWEYTTTYEGDVRVSRRECTTCGIYYVEKYDKYNRQVYYLDGQDQSGWYRTFVLCEYDEYRFDVKGEWYNGSGIVHAMRYNRYIQDSCTQYGTRLTYCKCCGYKDSYNYVTPSHKYYWNGTTYVCSRCGLENEKGVDGNFVVEDLTPYYGEYTVGFFNKLGERWEMEDGYNFYIVLNYDEENPENMIVTENVKFDLLEYGYEMTGAEGSGIITIDMESLNQAITEAFGEDWEGFEHVSLVFQVFDYDVNGHHSYVDHVITLSRLY